jgi:hypothetical protein
MFQKVDPRDFRPSCPSDGELEHFLGSAEGSVLFGWQAEKRKAERGLRLIRDFDSLDNLAERLSPKERGGVDDATHQVIKTQLAHEAGTCFSASLKEAVVQCSDAVDVVLRDVLQESLSLETVGELDVAAARFQELGRHALAFFQAITIAAEQYLCELHEDMTTQIARRTALHHRVIAGWVGQVQALSPEQALAVLERAAVDGIEIDESLRPPPSLGVTVLDPAMAYLDPAKVRAITCSPAALGIAYSESLLLPHSC